MSIETVLVLGNIIIPIGAGRGITQTLQPIENGDLRRTINGELLDLTRTTNRKFESQIACTDMSSPAITGLWRGSTIVVECIQQLRQTVDPASVTANTIRTAVAGSIIGRDVTEQIIDVASYIDPLVTFDDPVVFFEYRPILTMKILNISFNRDEYGAEESWTIDLEEV